VSKDLGHFVDLQRGTTYKSRLLGLPGPVLLGLASIAPNGGFRSDSLRTYGGESASKLLLKPGDLYVSLKDVTQSADLLGAVSRVPGSVAVGRLTQDTVKLILKDEHTSNSFLYWLLQTPQYREYCRGRATGTTNLGLSRDDFLSFPVPEPNSSRMDIVELLDALEWKIELNRRINETLEATARAIFKSWFVDFDPVRAKVAAVQPAGMTLRIAALFPSSFEQSSWGAIPQGWRTDVLEKVLSILETGGRPKGGVAAFTSGVPSIGAESIVGLAKFDYSKTKYVPQEFYDAMSKGRLGKRDVLLYKDGGRPGEFEPHVALLGDGFPFEKACINEHGYRLNANENYSDFLLYFWLTSDRTMEEMRRKGTGVAIPGLNSTAVRSLYVVIPDRAVVAAFDEIAEPLVTRALLNSKEAHTLAALRDTLLPKLMSGEIRVKQAEKVMEVAL
jgi:type I restriction enzyme S subunit